MSNTFAISAGQYTVEIGPGAYITGNIVELGDGPYEISLQYYNNTVSFTTRPTVDGGTLGNQPEFS